MMYRPYSYGLLFFIGMFFSLPCFAQTKSLAIVPVDKSLFTQSLAETLDETLSPLFKITDPELTQTVVKTSTAKSFFNLSLDEAKNIGTGLGCDHYLLLRSENLRRSSFKKNVYYEAFAAVFVVDGRTGELMFWKHLAAEADVPAEADRALLSQFKDVVKNIPEAMGKFSPSKQVLSETPIYEINDNSPASIRTPLPFRRFSPASTDLAQHLRIEAVVDVQVTIDEKGYVTNTRIIRWAGFGLDEEVASTVRRMNFRPTIVSGKAVPSSFVSRYNFRIPEAVKP